MGERVLFGPTEQCVLDQAKAIRKNVWLSELELYAIKTQVEDEPQSELCREQHVTVEIETVETDVRTVAAEINDAENSISDTEGDLSKKHWTSVEQLKEIMVEGRTGDAIMIKKVDKKFLKVQTDRINDAIKYLKSKKHFRNEQFD